MQNHGKLMDSWKALPQKTKKAIGLLAGGTILLALIAFLALNLGKDRSYSTLFTGLNDQEAQEVANLLQDEGVDYRFDTGNGTIRVPSASADQLRAELLSQGYPKSGFTYDMYLDNAGLMATESDKQQVTLYELQDRLGAQIRLFEGVRDAKVTIAMGDESRYALSDEPQTSASASAVITMDQGAELTTEKAKAVKNLISRSVRGMDFTNVSVFDASTMTEVAGDENTELSSGSAQDITNLTAMVENSIAANVRRVLEQLYGQGNVSVSVKGTLNMEKVIQENTQYTTPDKIDDQDKTGLLQRENVTNESSAVGAQGDGGVVGADANADAPRYTNETGDGQAQDTYANGSASREWLYNMMKEQRMVDPGVLEDTTVGVVITTDDTGTVSQDDLVNLVANSAGIPLTDAGQKITVVRAPAPPQNTIAANAPAAAGSAFALSAPLVAALGIGGLLILLLLGLLLRQNQRHRAQLEALQEEALIESEGTEKPSLEKISSDQEQSGKNGSGLQEKAKAEEEEENKNEEILNLRMQRSLRLKKNIGEFVDQNPQIAAKLIQSWLRGEE